MDPISSAGSADVGGNLRAALGWGVGGGELDTHTVISERITPPLSTGHCLRRTGCELWRFGAIHYLRQAKVYFVRHAKAGDMIVFRINILFQA